MAPVARGPSKPSSKMIEKSGQQEIDRRGKRLIREALEPLGWVMTEISEDYGVDYDVQVFVNGSPNGLWFKIQLKSSASSDRSADATFISVQLDLDHARHYAIDLRDQFFWYTLMSSAEKSFGLRHSWTTS